MSMSTTVYLYNIALNLRICCGCVPAPTVTYGFLQSLAVDYRRNEIFEHVQNHTTKKPRRRKRDGWSRNITVMSIRTRDGYRTIIFRTNSISVIEDCQRYLNFLPAKLVIDIHIANFMQQFSVSENDTCRLKKTNKQADTFTISYAHIDSKKQVLLLR